MVGAVLSLVVVPLASAEPRQRRKKQLAPPSLVAPVELEPAPLPPGLTLPQGSVQLQTTFEMSLSADSTASPTSIAPDVAVGVTDDLTMSYVHSGSALTGFRG